MPEVPSPSAKLPEWCFFLTDTGESVSIQENGGIFELVLWQAGCEPFVIALTIEQYARLQEAKTKATVEIEKKFLVSELPENLEDFSHTHLEQPYLIAAAKDEVRIRKKTKNGKSSYTLTIKSWNGAIRGEFETAISEGQYGILKARHIGNIIEKLRYEIPVGETTAELDLYLGTLIGNATVETEFATTEASEAFQAPTWFGKDESNNKRLKNKELALHGFPTDTYTQERMKKTKTLVEWLIIA